MELIKMSNYNGTDDIGSFEGYLMQWKMKELFEENLFNTKI